MSYNIFFSIVIPTYNRADFIGKTVESLLNQEYKNFEIIVIDDGSTDNTKEVISKFENPKVKYFYKKNEERGAARNFGVKQSKGDYINFFDSDDIAYVNHLNVACQTIQENESPEVFALNYDITDPNLKPVRSSPIFKNINRQLIRGNLLSCNGVFIQQNVALKNAFSEDRDLSASEDYLLWLKLASLYKIIGINIKTSTIIEHEDRSVLNTNKKKLIVRKKLMLNYAIKDPDITKYYSNKINVLRENTYSYISLHLAMSKNKKESIKFLGKALNSRFLFIFSKRFLAILKYLIR